MGKFCTNCGSELHSGARFCAKCGATVSSATANPMPQQPKPVPQSQPQAQPNPMPQQPSAAPWPSNPMPQPQPNRTFGQRTLCIVLAVLLVVQILAVALYGWPGFAVGGSKRLSVQKSESFTLQEGQTAVTTKSGVTVDFGPYNEMNGEKVSVKGLSADHDSVEGGTRTSYDISAGERSEFDGLLSITLPYDESETDPADEEGSVLAEYYNLETGEWELVDYSVNTQVNTVTITTDHLSEYCTVTLKDAGSPYAVLSKFTNKRLEDETALAVLREYEQTGQPGAVTESLMDELWDKFIQSMGVQNPGEPEENLKQDIKGWLFDAFELGAKGLGNNQAAKIWQLCGFVQLGLSAASLGGTMFDAYKGNESAENVAAEAYKLSYNVGVAWLDYKEVTSGMVSLSMLGVIALDYSLNKFMVAADQTYKDAVYQAVIAYNEKLYPWTEEQWYARIMGLYKARGNDPEKFNAALRGIMENYSSRYFYDTWEEQQVAANEAGLHTYTTDALQVTGAAREYCIEQYVARLGEHLQPVIEDVMKMINHDSVKAYSSSATELRKALNSPLVFEIVEEIPDGEKSQYAGFIVDLCRPDALVDDNWSAVLDKDGRVSIDATILGYLQAGVPTQLRLWQKGDDEFENDPILTQTFTVTEKVTVIPLGGAAKKYLLYQDTFETGSYYGGRTISEFYDAHGSMQNGRSLDEFKRDYGYIITLEGKGANAVLKVTEAPKGKENSPLYTVGKDGIAGTLDASGKQFSASYGNGETISIDFGAGTAYLNGPYTMRNFDSYMTPESRGLANGMRYGVQPVS
ncbi:MAG: zinc-ribbon domain-containing protein [Oscillospiraceae bacterium]